MVRVCVIELLKLACKMPFGFVCIKVSHAVIETQGCHILCIR